jgi:hypothetical protein
VSEDATTAPGGRQPGPVALVLRPGQAVELAGRAARRHTRWARTWYVVVGALGGLAIVLGLFVHAAVALGPAGLVLMFLALGSDRQARARAARVLAARAQAEPDLEWKLVSPDGPARALRSGYLVAYRGDRAVAATGCGRLGAAMLAEDAPTARVVPPRR